MSKLTKKLIEYYEWVVAVLVTFGILIIFGVGGILLAIIYLFTVATLLGCSLKEAWNALLLRVRPSASPHARDGGKGDTHNDDNNNQ